MKVCLILGFSQYYGFFRRLVIIYHYFFRRFHFLIDTTEIKLVLIILRRK